MMRRAALAVAWVALSFGAPACLDAGDPTLEVRDTTPPTVTKFDPTEGTTIALDEKIQITFSEPMDERTIRPGISLSRGGEPVAIAIEVPLDNGVPDAVEQTDRPWTIQVTPEQSLLPSSTYRLALDPILTDTEGNHFAGTEITYLTPSAP